MNRTLRAFLLATAVAAPSAVEGQDPAVRAWFHCDECPQVIFDAVIARGDSAVPALALALRPPTALELKSALLRAGAAWRQVALEAVQRGEPRAASDSTRFVFLMTRDGFAETEHRAVLALNAIRSASARSALEAFILRDTIGVAGVRPDVRRRAIAALATF